MSAVPRRSLDQDPAAQDQQRSERYGGEAKEGLREVQTQKSDQWHNDAVVVEEALEIRVEGRPLAVTLRTPGHDEELACGFLLAEGVIERAADLAECRAVPAEGEDLGAVVEVELEEAARDRWIERKVQREFRANSACGACGKPTLEDLFVEPVRAGGGLASGAIARWDPAQLNRWVHSVRGRQPLFERTGGSHSAAAFAATTESAEPLAVFEDVGRHNAIDKLVGARLRSSRNGQLLDGCVLLSSGRAGFETVQKALRARAAGVAALGAASSLAIELAREGRLPLVGFAASEPVTYVDAKAETDDRP